LFERCQNCIVQGQGHLTMEQKRDQSEKKKRVYLLGICGTGMAALAGLLKEQGFWVGGSDSGCYPPMDGVLESLGIEALKGYRPENVEAFRPDLVVIGNVIRRDNPEARFVIENQIPYMSFPEAMGHFFLSGKKPLVVAGTHGKTTTSTLLLSALEACGEMPGFMIGGVPVQKERGFGTGKGEWFVVEGDEYDSSFFQKVSKFLFYRPFSAIITSLEFDHADIFASLEDIKASFNKFASLLPKEGVLIACSDWKDVMDAATHANCPVITYGTGDNAHWQIRSLKIDEETTTFKAKGPSGRTHKVSISLPGRHNALNALSVVALCDALGLNMDGVLRGLRECKGVKRRQEVRGKVGDMVVIDDFAHHPRAVRETLEALRERFKTGRIVAIFEPRTNTSRRAVFQQPYVNSFGAADKIYVRQVPDPDKAPEGDRLSSERLVLDLKARGKEAIFCQDAGEIVERITRDFAPGDVFIVLSNGPFENIHQRLLEGLKKAAGK